MPSDRRRQHSVRFAADYSKPAAQAVRHRLIKALTAAPTTSS